MAEVIGVVAAGVAFGEAILKISSHTLKLKSMWEDFKEIPDSIKLLVGDIELLSHVLQNMEADLDRPTPTAVFWSDGISHLVVETCRKAVDELSASVDELSHKISSVKAMRRAARKSKLVLDHDFRAKLERRLQRVWNLLGVAQQHWSMSLARIQPDLIVARLQLSQSNPAGGQGRLPTPKVVEETHNTSRPRTLPRKLVNLADRRRDQLGKKHLGRSITGSIGIDKIESNQDCQQRAAPSAGGSDSSVKYYIHLKPPNWLSRKAWSIVSTVNQFGFDTNLRVYNVVPRDSPVLRYAEVGDVKSLLELFDKNLASPFDVSEDGEGLLDIAVIEKGGSAVATMIDWGLDFVNRFDPMRGQMFGLLKDWSQKHDIHENALAHGVFEEYADFWLAPADRTPSRASMLFSISVLSPQDEDFRLFLHHFRRGAHYQLPAHVRLLFCSVHPRDAKSLRRLLWSDGKVQLEDLQDLEDHGLSLIKIVARRMMTYPWLERGEWRQLLRDIAGSMALVTSSSETDFPIEFYEGQESMRHRHTALHVLIYELLRRFVVCLPILLIFSEWRRWSRCELQHWLEDLQAGGIDLSEYGEVESNLLRETEELNSRHYRGRLDSSGPDIRLVAFTYGPEPKDWEFVWEMETDDMVGEFWEMIDNPPLRIIGAWVDDA